MGSTGRAPARAARRWIGTTALVVGLLHALGAHAEAPATAPRAPAAADPAPGPAPAPADVWIYRVSPGDNLYDLARTYLRPGFGWRQLQRLNRVADPRRLPPDLPLRVPLDWLRPEATVATVAFVRGSVGLLRGEQAVPVPLKIGDTVQPGDIVQSEPGAEVTLRLGDGSRVLLGSNSRLRIASLLRLGPSEAVSSQFDLERGEADSRVEPRPTEQPRFRVRTPALTLGVRGTEFRVRVDGGDAAVSTEVTGGRVGAREAGTPSSEPRARPSAPAEGGAGVVLGAGQGLRREAGAAGPLRPVELAAAPDLSAVPSRLERLPIDLAWAGGGAGIDGWRAQVFADESLDRRLLDERFRGPRARWPDLPDGRYVLVVRAIDRLGLEGRDAVRAFEVDARPEPPFSSAPSADAKVYGDQVRLAWSRSEAAARYRLQVAGAAGFGGPLALDAGGLEASEQMVPLAPGRWQWRVASIANDGEQGPWGDPQAFELREVPAGPAGLSAEQGDDGRTRFRWAARAPGDRYDVQLVGAGFGDAPPVVADFARPRLAQRVDAPQVDLGTLEPGRYLMRVRTIDADGFEGPWGPAQSFEVPKTWSWKPFLPVIGILLILL